MIDLADAADLAAWRAAQVAARRAQPGYRTAARRRLAKLAHALLARDVAAATAAKGRGRQ